jgi:hypothetical protein
MSIELKAALNWMHVYEPTLLLGPFLNPKKSKLVVNFIIYLYLLESFCKPRAFVVLLRYRV